MQVHRRQTRRREAGIPEPGVVLQVGDPPGGRRVRVVPCLDPAARGTAAEERDRAAAVAAVPGRVTHAPALAVAVLPVELVALLTVVGLRLRGHGGGLRGVGPGPDARAASSATTGVRTR